MFDSAAFSTDAFSIDAFSLPLLHAFSGGDQAVNAVGNGVFNAFTLHVFSGGEQSTSATGSGIFSVGGLTTFSGGEQATDVIGAGLFNVYTLYTVLGGEQAQSAIGSGLFIIDGILQFSGGDQASGAIGTGSFIALSTHTFGGGEQADSAIGAGVFAGGLSFIYVQGMINQVRLKLDDEIEPEIFSDATILQALNDAQNEFCVQTLCLFDAQDTVNILALDKWVTLPEGTVWLAAASIGGVSLRLITQHELEYGYFDLTGVEISTRFSGWRSVVGDPVFLVTDLGAQKARLVPRPVNDITLFLERYRIPDADMSLSVNVEVAPQFHPDLVIGALAYLFEIPDRETYDPEQAILQRVAWGDRIQLAQRSLQTDLRASTRAMDLPADTDFVYTTNNTNGVSPIVNTET